MTTIIIWAVVAVVAVVTALIIKKVVQRILVKTNSKLCTVVLVICCAVLAWCLVEYVLMSLTMTEYTPTCEVQDDGKYILTFPEVITHSDNTYEQSFTLYLLVDTDSAVCNPSIFDTARHVFCNEYLPVNSSEDIEQAQSLMAEIATPYIDGATVLSAWFGHSQSWKLFFAPGQDTVSGGGFTFVKGNCEDN